MGPTRTLRSILHRVAASPAVLVLLLALSMSASPVAAELGISSEKTFEQSTMAAQKALSFYGEYEDPEQKRRVLDVAYRLAAVSRFERFPFSVYLIDMPVPNAFALPGGHVFVTRGMLDLGLDDDMLACLLGHELAHVIYDHGQRMQRRATLLNILSQAALLGVMIGVDDDGEPANPNAYPYGRRGDNRKGSLVQGAAASGIVFTELLMRRFSRGFEDEADVEGQRLAAAAGYDPDGARRLWELMNERLPQSKEYGYWRTHPYSDTRQRAAEVRASELKIQDKRSPADYRALTQTILLDFRDTVEEDDAISEPPPRVERGPSDPRSPRAPRRDDQVADTPLLGETPRQPWESDLRVFLEKTALDAWPEGRRAEELRMAHLDRLRAREMERDELSRDYGALVRATLAQIEEVRALTPESSFVAQLQTQQEELRAESEKVYPKALEVWTGGVYQTPFLETFLSNWPTAEPVPDIALALANAYSRVRRESDAVRYYLRAREAGPGTEAGQRALRGLRNLTPYLEELVALQQLAEGSVDEELRTLAAQRLDEMAGKYQALENGSAFLHDFPESPLAPRVEEQLEKLAQNLYGEVVLYQGLGDHVKALERIQRILEHAPMTTAAEALRQRAVLES